MTLYCAIAPLLRRILATSGQKEENGRNSYCAVLLFLKGGAIENRHADSTDFESIAPLLRHLNHD